MLSGSPAETGCDPTDIGQVSTAAKRRRTDAEAASNIVAGSRANDMIALLFYNTVVNAGSGDRTDHYECSPEYTHQLFDDERVVLTVPEGRHIREVRIRVFVDCRDLSHSIIFPPRSLLAHEEARQLLQRMRSGLPPDCAVIEDDLLLSTDSCWRGGEVLKRIRRTSLPASNDPTWEVPFRLLSSCCDPWTVCRPSYRAPPGQLVDSFIKGDLQLAVHLASNAHEGAGLLLRRAEKLAMWFIETADSVDFSDDRWEVLFLFAAAAAAGDTSAATASTTTAQKMDRFVGYFTLFSFRNPYLGTNFIALSVRAQTYSRSHLTSLYAAMEHAILYYATEHCMVCRYQAASMPSTHRSLRAAPRIGSRVVAVRVPTGRCPPRGQRGHRGGPLSGLPSPPRSGGLRLVPAALRHWHGGPEDNKRSADGIIIIIICDPPQQ